MGGRSARVVQSRIDPRTSYEGRDIWLVTVTNTETGPALDKPAFLVEANIHSMEWTGCTAALHLIHKLVTEHAKDERVTRALDTRAFYVIPRLNPDGAERGLAERRFIRSSVRPYPREQQEDGLHGGRRRRRTSPLHAGRGSERRVEATSRRAATARSARSCRRARGRAVLPAPVRRTDRELRRRDDQDSAAARRARSHSQLPGRV
ncbi:MAG: hypothetical protein E6G64_07695, partial [Actinobacteria bacterium]